MNPTPIARFAALALVAGLASAASARTESSGASSLVVARPWSRPAPAGGAGVVYLTITNRGARPDALVGAASPAAARVTIHQTLHVGAVTAMRSLASLPIPAGRAVSLVPGGAHLMLEDLTRPLRPGDRIAVTLTFSRAGARTITSVVGVGEAEPMAGMRM